MKLRCNKPNIGYIVGQQTNKDGTVGPRIVWSAHTMYKEHYSLYASGKYKTIVQDCGHCPACLKKKRRELSLRVSNELQTVNNFGTFITLTYNNEHLPPNGELVKRDVQLFLKRLRKNAKLPKDTRYILCGEYGPQGDRPHFHLLIFGWRPTDVTKWKFRQTYWEYRSPIIEKCWTLGFSTVGWANANCGNYIAGYVTKKFEKKKTQHKQSEFVQTSTRTGGMGFHYLKSKYKEIFDRGYLINVDRRRGIAYKLAIPKYYWRKLKSLDLDLYYKVIEKVSKTLSEMSQWTQEEALEYWHQMNCAVQKYLYDLERETRSYEVPQTLLM